MDSVDDRTTEVSSSFREHVDSIGDRLLSLGGQCRPPVNELVGDLDFPHALGQITGVEIPLVTRQPPQPISRL